MLPNPVLPPFTLGPLVLHPFGVLVGLGVVLAYFTVEYALDRWGLRKELTAGLVACCFIGGAVGGHLFDVLVYNPHRLVEEGWIVLLIIPDGLASLGSFMGAFGLGLWYLRRKGEPAWPYVDACVLGLAVGWTFGRMGCTVAYDHPGPLTDFVLGMPYTGVEVSHGVRHNLGFYEAIYSLGLVGFFAATFRRPHFVGWVTLVFGLAYMPMRFALDFLRAADRTIAGLTPGQYVCVAAFAACVWLYRKRRHGPVLRAGAAHAQAV